MHVSCSVEILVLYKFPSQFPTSSLLSSCFLESMEIIGPVVELLLSTYFTASYTLIQKNLYKCIIVCVTTLLPLQAPPCPGSVDLSEFSTPFQLCSQFCVYCSNCSEVLAVPCSHQDFSFIYTFFCSWMHFLLLSPASTLPCLADL